MKSEEPFTLHKLILYSKPECHLCDQARMVVAAVDPQFVLEEIDISCNTRLTSNYGERIPVPGELKIKLRSAAGIAGNNVCATGICENQFY